MLQTDTNSLIGMYLAIFAMITFAFALTTVGQKDIDFLYKRPYLTPFFIISGPIGFFYVIIRAMNKDLKNDV